LNWIFSTIKKLCCIHFGENRAFLLPNTEGVQNERVKEVRELKNRSVGTEEPHYLSRKPSGSTAVHWFEMVE
jgi:hypothetical protein